jgi:hypothetical protein
MWGKSTVAVDYGFGNVYWQLATTETRRMAITRGDAALEVGERAFRRR